MRSKPAQLPAYEPIAIVGIGCRVSGARGPREFWNLLKNGADVVREVPPERWDAGATYDRNPLKPGRSVTKWGSFLDGIDTFDPSAFDVSPREAKSIDPQHRLLLEAAWDAVDDAGIAPSRIAGRPGGVFVGLMTNDYAGVYGDDLGLIDGYFASSNVPAFAANRISYFFDLTGPSIALDGTSAASLLAVHVACQNLWTGQAEFAFVGGASVILTPDINISMSKASALSPTGRCYTFDARADGFVRGEGVGVVLLKPLSQAERDGDRVYATIVGTATRHTGHGGWIMAPDIQAQTLTIRAAQAVAGIEGKDINYVELHGTGTPTGDPVEAQALSAAVSEGRSSDRPCRVGSVKTNVGHLDAAAGIAGLIKVALSIHHGEIPASLNFQRCNAAIDLDKLRLAVATRHEPWPNVPRRLAGVTSVGFGGVNVHAILAGERPLPSRVPSGIHEGPLVLPLSAKSESALRARAGSFAQFLSEDVVLSDVVHTAAVCRDHHTYRVAVIGSSREEMATRLAALAAGSSTEGAFVGRKRPARAPRLVFVYPGHGPQFVQMGTALLESNIEYRRTVETCDEIVRRIAGWSILAELRADATASRIERTDVIQPLVFTLEVALTRVLATWGLVPGLVMGHSFGEVAAAHVAGALSLEDALALIVSRGEACQKVAGRGGVVLALASEEDLAGHFAELGSALVVGGVNGPRATLVSGDSSALEAFVERCDDAGIRCQRIALSFAAHSHHMDLVLDDFASRIATLRGRAPTVAFASTVDGQLRQGTPLPPSYWLRNLRDPVRFRDLIERIATSDDSFVEIGPTPVLLSFVERTLKGREFDNSLVPTLRRGVGDEIALREMVGRLYVSGHRIDWAQCVPAGNRIDLPLYPFQRRRCWLFPSGRTSERPSATNRAPAPGHPLVGQHVEVVEPRCHVWEASLDLERQPYLADHRVAGRIVAPAAVYIEQILETSSQVLRTDEIEILDLEFKHTLYVPESGCRKLQVKLEEDQGKHRVRILGQDDEPHRWKVL